MRGVSMDVLRPMLQPQQAHRLHDHECSAALTALLTCKRVGGYSHNPHSTESRYHGCRSRPSTWARQSAKGCRALQTQVRAHGPALRPAVRAPPTAVTAEAAALHSRAWPLSAAWVPPAATPKFHVLSRQIELAMGKQQGNAHLDTRC